MLSKEIVVHGISECLENISHPSCKYISLKKHMAGEMPKQEVCECKWNLAYIKDLQDEVKRLREENEHLSRLVWYSKGSREEKERAAAAKTLYAEADEEMLEYYDASEDDSSSTSAEQ